MDLELEVQIGDDVVEVSILVNYELIRQQADCGIMQAYAEIGSIEINDDEYKNNPEVLKHIEDSMQWIEDRVNDSI